VLRECKSLRLHHINKEAIENPDKLDKETWIVEVHPIDRGTLMAELSQLMTEEKYKEFLKTIEGQLPQ